MIKKLFKFIFVTIGLLIALFIAAAIIIPIVYKDKLLAEVKTALNENLDAKTDFKSISISLFTHFPNLSLQINDLSIVGKESFSHDTLIIAKRIDLAMNLKKAINGIYDIQNIDFIDPRIHAIVKANGQANWNIIRSTPDATTAAPSKKHFSINLRNYAIEHGFICYKDDQRKISVIIEDLVHKGSGEFKNDLFTLKTETSANALTVTYGKISYLNDVNTKISFDITVDNRNNKYSFDTKDIKLNGLNVSAKGFVQLPDTTSTVVDITFQTPSNDFKDFLSLVPGIYQESFKDIKTTGKASVQGEIKGTYNSTRIPGFNITLDIADGSFQYPGLPQKISNVNIKLTATNPDGIPDHSVINLEKGHIDFGPEPFDFHLLMKNPVSTKWVDAYASGKINLSQMEMFVKLPAGTKLSGLIDANVSIKKSLADLEKREYDSVDVSGTITVDNLNFSTKEYPEPAILKSLVLSFDPDSITVSNLDAQYLNTRFTGEGKVHNLLGYYLHNGILSGSLHLTADHIDGNKWKKYFTTPKAKVTTPQPPETAFVAPPDLNITFDAQVSEIEYDHVKIKEVQGLMVIGNEIINIQNVQAHALEGDVKIDGHYSSVKDKANPDLDFEYIVSLGRLNVLHKHITHL